MPGPTALPDSLKALAEKTGELSRLWPTPLSARPYHILRWKDHVKRYFLGKCAEFSHREGHPEWFLAVLTHLSIGFGRRIFRAHSTRIDREQVSLLLQEVVKEIRFLRAGKLTIGRSTTPRKTHWEDPLSRGY